LDDPLREAFGFPKANTAFKNMLEGGLKLSGSVVRHFFPARTAPYAFTQVPNRTYPLGYEIERLGPTDVPRDRTVRK
jgi:hypothetical protein